MTRGATLIRGALALAVLGWAAVVVLLLSARWTWPGELAVHFQPFVAFGGLGLAALLFRARRRRVAALVALVACALAAPLAQYLPWRTPPADVPVALRVATLNLHRDRPQNLDLDAWLARHELDVIAFQEVSPLMAGWLRERLAGEGHLAFLPAEPEALPRGRYGAALFTRAEPLALERVNDGWNGAGFLRARLDVGGREVLVHALHGTRPGRGDRNGTRDAALLAVAESAAASPTAIVLGDLNTTAFSPSFGRALDVGHLRDSRVGIGWQRSYAPFDAVPWLHLLAIDHVLVGEAWTVLSREVGEDIGSDHLPVRAALGFAPGAELSRP